MTIVDTTVQDQVENLQVENTEDASQEDAVTLGRIWKRLGEAKKSFAAAQRQLRDSHHDPMGEPADEAAAFLDAAHAYAATMRQSWDALIALPKGTVAKGQATPHSVALEFYGSVNRGFRTRMTAQQAKARNKAAFGG